MTNLDDLKACSRLDSAGMRKHIAAFPEYCLEAWQEALSLHLPATYADVDRVLILGMGGSAIAGDLLQALTEREGAVQVLVHRDYGLPRYLNARTLVIASSYSGQTEETLDSFARSLETEAKNLVLTSGGKLKELADRKGVPTLRINHPGPPRAALAHSFMSLLGVFQGLGIISDKSRDVTEMSKTVRNLQGVYGAGCPAKANPAKQLAARLPGNVAVIYGSGFLSPVARRWKTQINENSKALAFYEILPELNHNAVVGFEFPAEPMLRVFVVLLRSSHLHPRIKARYEATCDMLGEAHISHQVVEAPEGSALSEMMALVLLGDWTSYYLALLYNTDPSPVPAIDLLKKRLSEM